MMQVNFSLRSVGRLILSAALVFCLIVSFTSTVLAAPTGDISQESSGPAANMYYVDLRADVPDGFDGRVAVLLSHESGEYYTVSCDRLSGYKGSAEIPKGEYWVEKAYTSEDNLTYEAFLEVESFILGDKVQLLNVTVKHNAEGTNPTVDAPGNEPATDEPSVVQPVAPPSQNPADPDNNAPDIDANEQDTDKEQAPDETPEPEGGIWQVIKSLLIFLAGSAVFACIVFVVVYFVRRRMD